MPSAAAQSENYRFSHLTMEQGLSSNLAFCMQQDSKGFMWVGTLSGLNRYDGNKVTVYSPEVSPGSITSSLIFAIFEDSENRLWVGTDGGGLNRYIRESDSFISYTHDPYEPFSISSNQIYSIIEDKEGSLWFGTDGGGLNKMLSDGEFISFRKDMNKEDSLKSDTIRVLYQDSDGNILAGTERGGLSLLKRNGSRITVKTYTPENKAGSIPSDTVRSIYEDSENNIWIGFQNGGAARFIPESGEFIQLNIPGFKNQNDISVRALFEDNNKNLWVGTEKEGIYIYSLKNRTWKSVKTNSYDRFALSSNTIRSIYSDKNSLIWIGTRDGGVNIFNPEASNFSSLPKKGGSLSSSGSRQTREIITGRNGNIWYATDGGGLSVFNRESGSIKTYSSRDSGGILLNDQCYSLAEDENGFIWVGTDGGGLSLFNPETEKWIKNYSSGRESSLNSDTVWDIYFDSSGGMWAGTEGGGLSFFDRKTEKFKTYKYDPKDIHSLNGNSVRDILEDSKGRFWVGTWDGGLNLFNRDSEKFARFIFDPESDISVSDNSINSIFEDSQKRIWIGTTGGGLNLFNERDLTFTSFKTEDGLAGNNVLAITEDIRGKLWITTNNGLNIYNSESNKLLTLSREDGLISSEFTHKAACTASDGTIFIGGTEGINFFNPDNIKTGIEQPGIVFTELKIMNRKIRINRNYKDRIILEKTITETEMITLTQDDKLFTFDFSIMDFAAPERNRYFTMLEGYENTWKFNSGRNSVTFDSIPYGNYTLRVKGTDHNGHEIPEQLKIDIKILPYFWQTFYFKILAAGMFILIIFSIIKIRTRALEKHNRELRLFSTHILEIREEERKKIAREVHDELGQLLTALKIDIFQTDSGEKKDNMLSLVNMALESVKNLSTRLRPKALDTLSFSEALQWQIVEFQRRTKINCTTDIEEISINQDKETATVIFRIFQESLTNIIRHSGASNVNIVFKHIDHSIFLRIKDNGKGLKQEELNSTSSFGIIGMKERSNMIGGKLKIDSGSNGTVIELTIPMKDRPRPKKSEVNKTLYDTMDGK